MKPQTIATMLPCPTDDNGPGLDLDGTLVQVWRSGIDGRIVVHVDTSAGLDEDHHEPGGCPKIRVGINDHYTNLEPGGWEEQDG